MFTGEGKKFKTPTHIYRHVYTYTKKKEKELPVNLKTTKHAPLYTHKTTPTHTHTTINISNIKEG